MFPTFLDTYNWYWPTNGDGEDGAAAAAGDALEGEEDESGEDRISGAFDLNPCQFGVPASRSRCYTVPSLTGS